VVEKGSGRATMTSMGTARRLHYDYADYLRSLEVSPLKLEYCEGVIYAMAGGTRAHAELGAAVIAALHRVLPKGRRPATSDLKVRVEASDLSTFPDASVVCGEAVASSLDANAITNPALLVEVTSKSTEDYDRGEKLSHYKQLPSLRAVLYVSRIARARSRSSPARLPVGPSRISEAASTCRSPRPRFALPSTMSTRASRSTPCSGGHTRGSLVPTRKMCRKGPQRPTETRASAPPHGAALARERTLVLALD
jgi:Uma2 family endonuclease